MELFRKYPKKELVSNLSNINSLLRKGSEVFSDTLILLDEKLSGNLFCTEKVVIEQNGVLSGNITSKICVVSGAVNGNVLSTGQLEIKSTAIIRGNIKSALINIEPGAVINGSVTITNDTEAVIANVTKKIKEHSANKYLQDKPYTEITEFNNLAAPDADLVLTRELPPSENLNLDKLNTDVQPGLELTELNWAFNPANYVDKLNNDHVLSGETPVLTPAIEPKAPVSKATEQPAVNPDAVKEENNQRWW